MEVVELRLDRLVEAPWNPNAMDAAGQARLRESIARYGLVVPLVVRPLDESFEVLSGNRRLAILRELGFVSASCVAVDLDDAHARLLAQALNRIHGDDDLGLRAELLRTVLEHLTPEQVLAVLPESAQSLQQFASLGRQDMAGYLQEWQQAQAARLHHFTFQFTDEQLTLVRETLEPFVAQVSAGDGGNPNRQGLALLLLCQSYRELREGKG